MTLSMTQTYRRWPRWYRGDFHAHTVYSDGVLSPPQLLEEALKEQLDFFSVTDHNTIAAFPHFGQHEQFLIIPGVEVTMPYGHFNVFGLESAPDWLNTLPTTRADYQKLMTEPPAFTPTELMRLTKAQGLYNSINHPLLEPWAWLDRDTDLTLVDFVEIWNDPTWPDNGVGNPSAIDLWTQWLNEGFRITAIGGTDFHSPRPEPQKDGSIVVPNRMNKPTTYVYAEELSGRAIIQALTQHHAYVTMGPTIAFTATHNNQAYMIGDILGEVDGPLHIHATAHNLGTTTLQLIKNGQIICQTTGDNQISLQTQVQLQATQFAWYRLDIRNAQGHYLATTNPIYSGPPRHPQRIKYDQYLT